MASAPIAAFAAALAAALDDGERRCLLARVGRYRPGARAAEVEAQLGAWLERAPGALVALAQADAVLLARLWPAASSRATSRTT